MPDIHGLLRASFGFDIERRECGDGFETCLGRAAGADRRELLRPGVLPVRAEEDARPTVVLANPQGAGGLIPDDLASALKIIIGLKWQACLGFSGGGDLEVMQPSAQHLERHPDRTHPEIAEERAHVTAALGH
ncbi:hypothetical protein [Streptomyces sp. NPDC004680]|uniref:hypothetical protein n=1 Tax=Streptomyces sp. NPDC004680 TaxID=3154287 RepID=UPI0033A6BCC2